MSAALDEESARALVEDFADAIISYESEVLGGTDHGRREAQNQISKTRTALLRALTAYAPAGTRDDGIEAAAKWHDDRAADCQRQRTLAQKHGSHTDEHHWDDLAATHEHFAEQLRALKSTPSLQVDYEVPSEQEIAADIPEVTELYRRSAPAVSGEGWMADAVNEIAEAEFDGPISGKERLAIIRRHFPSPEGRDG